MNTLGFFRGKWVGRRRENNGNGCDLLLQFTKLWKTAAPPGCSIWESITASRFLRVGWSSQDRQMGQLSDKQMTVALWTWTCRTRALHTKHILPNGAFLAFPFLQQRGMNAGGEHQRLWSKPAVRAQRWRLVFRGLGHSRVTLTSGSGTWGWFPWRWCSSPHRHPSDLSLCARICEPQTEPLCLSVEPSATIFKGNTVSSSHHCGPRTPHSTYRVLPSCRPRVASVSRTTAHRSI